MKQSLVDSSRLSKVLRKRVLGTYGTYDSAAEKLHIGATRISRFCNGEFQRLSPGLKNFCSKLSVDPQSYITDDEKNLTPDVAKALKRAVNANPRRKRLVLKILRSLAELSGIK